jgi:DNA-binding LacI/PurR family transcriptional regulator
MGYMTNPIARALAVGRTGVIGLIVPDIANPFFPPIIKAVQARAGRKDTAVLLADTDEHASDELERARVLSKQVDGLILVSPRTPEDRLAEFVQLAPVVFVNRRVEGAPSIIIDNSDGITQAVQHLTALGHHRICYLNGPRRSWSNDQRRAALQEACARYNVELIELGPFEPQVQAGVHAADLVQAGGATAVIAYDDQIALGLMARLAEHRLQVGRDISVIGIDDSRRVPDADLDPCAGRRGGRGSSRPAAGAARHRRPGSGGSGPAGDPPRHPRLHRPRPRRKRWCRRNRPARCPMARPRADG